MPVLGECSAAMHRSAGSRAPGATIQGDVGLTPDDIRRFAAELEPGTAALFLLFEHTWASELKQAVRNAGGVPVVQGFLTPEAVLLVGAELQAMVEAEATIELAEAVKGAALLDALMTLEEAALAADEALRVSDEVVSMANTIRAQAAAEAVRALIVADLLGDADAQEAAAVLVAAGVIDAEALAEAEQAVQAAQAEAAAADA